MRYHFISHQQSKLIVYFSGWGTPIAIAEQLTLPEEYDLLICYDYCDLNLDFDFSRYDEINVVAWSLGVWVANNVMATFYINSATAINGTVLPRNDAYGIPCHIFDRTLDTLTEENLAKFQRRICSKQDLAWYRNLPARDFNDIKIELYSLKKFILSHSSHHLLKWDLAIIGNKDKIFSSQHQQAYWEKVNNVKIKFIDAEHYLFSSFSSWSDLIYKRTS